MCKSGITRRLLHAWKWVGVQAWGVRSGRCHASRVQGENIGVVGEGTKTGTGLDREFSHVREGGVAILRFMYGSFGRIWIPDERGVAQVLTYCKNTTKIID
ncbi:hypothetical protein MA16_Dca011969 [Dendrobium catenatum]|uniref:Uncharacterized protein n=1 Tax=Dendrobium catenatum TaxID=906689 RepID=A0A2I0WDT4_9ASPA|nr:hypothetical protein MA16_Dca011969 [Dendrobium catenatum]